ncbi:thioredoxin family protein [Alienimonas californiensis]|uniref:Thioredoxin domain-containing protein n=1 Tax=Alienimonas californiensis TaxID=2527989 RepID=A0A517P8H5_9PLAN|nr:thioredoxin family protein [Alienimonas californiensis]QDT15678.1 hypothetical protein CA12_17680 [Alienimonas californiensis]
MSRLACLLFAVALCAAFPLAAPSAFAQVRPTTNAQAAMTASAATGQPILAVAGHTGCVYCRQIKDELTSATPAAKVAENFVVLLMDTDQTPSWPAWDQQFPNDGGGVPKVYVVRADGTSMYAGSGKPSDLDKFLSRYLDGNGKVYLGKDLAQLNRDVRSMNRLARRDRAAYVKMVADYSATLSFAAPVAQFVDAAEELASEAEQELTAAAETLEDPAAPAEKRLDAALALHELARDFEPLAAEHARITDRIAELEYEEKTPGPNSPAAYFTRAGLWTEAQAAEEARQWADAVAKREALIAAHPKTEAARRAADGLDDLRRRAEVAAGRE